MRSKRGIRLTTRQARRMFRLPPQALKKRGAQPRVSQKTWEQIDAIRRAASVSAPWRTVPGMRIRLTGQLPSGKNRQGIRVAQEQAITGVGAIVEVPRIVKHPWQRFVAWREASLNELMPQLRSWPGTFPLTLPLMLYVWYWPSDRRIRDRSGMLDAIFHMLEQAGVVADDGLIEDTIWRTMELDRRCPRVEMVLRPFVCQDSGRQAEGRMSSAGCPCCALPLVS